MKVFLFDCAVFEQMDVRGTHVFGLEHQRERGCWSLIFLFIVSYWQYDILMNTDRRNVSHVQLHIEQDAGSFWISWLAFPHNFRGVIREAMQHFTSCYKVADCSRLVFCQESSGEWSRKHYQEEEGPSTVRSAVCLGLKQEVIGFWKRSAGTDWWCRVIKTGLRSDQHPLLSLFLQDMTSSKVHLLPRVYDWHLLITARRRSARLMLCFLY